MSSRRTITIPQTEDKNSEKMRQFIAEYLRENLTVSVDGTSGYQQDGFKVRLLLCGETFSEDTYYLD